MFHHDVSIYLSCEMSGDLDMEKIVLPVKDTDEKKSKTENAQ